MHHPSRERTDHRAISYVVALAAQGVRTLLMDADHPRTLEYCSDEVYAASAVEPRAARKK